MRCPWCGDPDDRVIDSRMAEDGSAIRRRRECIGCERRYTTFERIEQVPVMVIKRNGTRESFDRFKVEVGVRAALKNRPIARDAVSLMLAEVEEAARNLGTEITSEEIGGVVLSKLKELDEVAYVRFASVYKGFESVEDFRLELKGLAEP